MKRLVILSLSTVFFAVCWLRDRILRLAGITLPGSCTVLYYHAVPEEHQERFERQMDLLLKLAEPAAADLKSMQPGRLYAAVTFDDAYENILTNALPGLEVREIPSTVFVVPEMCGQTANLSDLSTSLAEQRKVMTRETVRHLPSRLVAVGSHTLTHPYLTRLSIEEAAHELQESRHVLETLLQRPVRLFSFPYGDCNEEVFRLCRTAGYQRIFTTLPHVLRSPDAFVAGRVRVDPTDWPIEFRLKLLGAYRWLPSAFVLKRRLFHAFHRNHRRIVASGPEPQPGA